MIFEMGILSARKVGVLLAVFWIGTLCYIWLPDHIPDFLNIRSKSLVGKDDPLKKLELVTPHQLSPMKNETQKPDVDSGPLIHVCISSDAKTLGGMVALINSIMVNTKSPVKFHLIVDEDSMDHLTIWILKTKLKDINYEIKTFPYDWVKGKIKIKAGRKELSTPLNYARFYLPRLLPDVKEKIVYIDADCIVQGDIKELQNTHIAKDKLIAVSEDCKGMNKRLSGLNNVYAEFIDMKNPNVIKMKMKPDACSFNTGVFVTNLGDWNKNNVTAQLEYWLELNTKEDVYGNERGGGGSQPPMMLVFYNKHSSIDPIWHIRYLGKTTGTSYSKSFIKHAKLLHWNGVFKPWGRASQHKDIWLKYFIPDPLNKFRPITRS